MHKPHRIHTHTNLIILLTNFKLVMSYPNYLNYPTFWLFGFWKLYDSVKHESVFVLLVEYKSDKVFLHFFLIIDKHFSKWSTHFKGIVVVQNFEKKSMKYGGKNFEEKMKRHLVRVIDSVT